MKDKEKTVAIIARLPKIWDDELKKIARAEFRTKASLIRAAIWDYLKDKVIT
uniref:Uncharacterized protein n=1 Tax=viral metagenome TaxID=1070528 RepID=A0A6M3X676_9ZZZZ